VCVYTYINTYTKSCANLVSVEEGAQFHARAVVSGLISFITVSIALVTLYGKCGSIRYSRRMFNDMKIRDEGPVWQPPSLLPPYLRGRGLPNGAKVSWTALVSGYAQFGEANETIDLFERMLAQGLKPVGVTFIGVLSACSRAGFVEKGHQYFESIIKEHGIYLIWVC
jgi:pentatricopeptide repeat protein